MDFDEYGKLLDEQVLIGKTVASVVAVDSHPESSYPGRELDAWVVTFTDGSAVKLAAHYDDSDVTFRSVDA
jgi:hypothetical protein